MKQGRIAMYFTFEFARRGAAALLVALLIGHNVFLEPAMADVDPKTQQLIDKGAYADAEKLLEQQIADPSAPISSDAAIQLEILRRTRQDFPHSSEQVLTELKKSVPDATQADVDRWRSDGSLQARRIDGEPRYFRNAVANLFRLNPDAKKRQQNPATPKKFNTTALVEELVKLSDSADGPEIFPVLHKVHYELTVQKEHPRLKPGAVVRTWLPFPQEYRQQRNVKLLKTEPTGGKPSGAGSPHRTIYFEQTVSDPKQPPRFMAEFEFVTSAYCPKLDPAKVKPYDTEGEVYRTYTAERPPHIVFTPEIKALSQQIVGDEKNPLERALRIFRWTSKNVPWVSEMEYSIIPNLSAKGLSARCGDCGVQGMSFTTLCRAAGVPARWQSGWQSRPGDWNMHDWSEIYIEPWGWLPVDASYGVREHSDPRVRDFFCGHMDPYRLIVNLDYAQPLQPPKTSFRSEPNDFQRGEIEIDGHNLYFDEWDYKFDVETTPLANPKSAAAR